MFMKASAEIERLLQHYGLPYYRMDGRRSLFVVLVRMQDLPDELVPAVIATRSSDLIVGGEAYDHIPDRFRKGWPHSLTDEEAAALGVSRGTEKPAMMGGVAPTNLHLEP